MHLTEQTDQPKPTVFPKRWTSRNNRENVILKYGKGGGGDSRTSLIQLEFYFDASLFAVYSFVSFFFFCLRGCSFPSSSSPLKENNLSVDRISYYLFVCVLAFLCST